MIEAIGSVNAPQAKTDDYAAVESDQAVQENDRIVEERPVEETGKSADSEFKSDKNEAEQFVLKENKMVFEKYNGSGDVILQIPSLHHDIA